MDNSGLEPANADDKAPVETGEVDSNPVDTEGADPATAAAETGKPVPRDKVQERFDTLTREKYEALSARDRERYQREALEARIAQLEASTAKTETVAPSDEYPTLESVGWDEDKLRVAIDAYYDKKLDARAESTLTKREKAAQRQQVEQAHERREAEFIKAKPDYAEKVLRHPRDGGPTITDPMAEVIRASDSGPELAYYLAENAPKSAEIARLPERLQALELGRILERIAAAKAAPPPVSKAPPPVAKIEAAEPPTDTNLDNQPYEVWAKAERKRMEKVRLARIGK
jgi:hypothetical protein